MTFSRCQGTKDIERVEQWLDRVERKYGAVAAPAFAEAMKLKPPPDIVFLMTDGLLNKNDPDRIAVLNSGPEKATIHTILFTKTGAVVPPENGARRVLERIAREAGGTFRQFTPGEGEMKIEPKKKKNKKV